MSRTVPDAGAADPEFQAGPERVITLTDGVVAIAITLLGLDLKPDLPAAANSRELAHWFAEHASQYATFVLAFVLVAQYWVVHHRVLRGVVRHDGVLTWLNMLFLFGITCMPITTYVQGTYSAALGNSLFAANLAVVGIAVGAMSELINRRGLRAAPSHPEAVLLGRSRAVTTTVVAVAVAGLVWVVGPPASWLFFLYFAADVPGRLLLRRRAAREAAAAA